MQCPACDRGRLVESMTKQGVLIDKCPDCDGTWLDRGELYLFSSKPKQLHARVQAGPGDHRPSQRRCPRCDAALQARGFLEADLEVDECPGCEGLWFDAGELRRVLELDRKLLRMETDRALSRTAGDPSAAGHKVDFDRDQRARLRMQDIARGATPLPNLLVRSASVLLLLYGLVAAVLIALVELGYMVPGLAVGIGLIVLVGQFVFSPWIMDLSLRFMYRFRWLSTQELPGHLRSFVERVARDQNMRLPSFGLIEDGAPNAFTYGHTPNNMRIVISRGVLELLEPDEVEGVVAHEIGHGKHWDMALMTVAQLVPLLLYYLYRTALYMRSSSRDEDKSAAVRIAIAVGAYILYIVSQYIVLWFSRCREYHADRFAGKVTGNPNALASGLVKIAYGLAAQGRPAGRQTASRSGQTEPSGSRGRLDALGAMGIFDAGAARSLVLSASSAATGTTHGGVSTENLKSAMQWDLWNPWARFYELNSTHPLVAHRLRYLSEQSAALGHQPYVVFDRRKPESYWDDFLVDLAVMFLPILALLLVVAGWLLLGGPTASLAIWIGAGIAAMGTGSLLKTLYTYRGGYFAPLSVAGLLHKVKVSSVRPVPAQVKGRIIGRGVPGLIWSEDFVLRDPSGILFLDYRQPLRIWEWLFGLLRAGSYAGKEVSVTGWFRRAPVPYLEIKTMQVDGRTRRCYAYHMKLAVAFGLIALGLFCAVSGQNLFV